MEVLPLKPPCPICKVETLYVDAWGDEDAILDEAWLACPECDYRYPCAGLEGQPWCPLKNCNGFLDLDQEGCCGDPECGVPLSWAWFCDTCEARIDIEKDLRELKNS
jgi:hypothetical protein